MYPRLIFVALSHILEQVLKKNSAYIIRFVLRRLSSGYTPKNEL
jgi:hypothetical protein